MESLFSLLSKGRMMGEEGLPSLAREYDRLKEMEDELARRERELEEIGAATYMKRGELLIYRESIQKQRTALRKGNPVAYAIVSITSRLGMRIGG